MKRTGEIVLTVIGMLIGALFGAVGYFLDWAEKNSGEMQKVFDDSQAGAGMTYAEYQDMMQPLEGLGFKMLIFAILIFVAGIIAIILLKGNKNAKVAGIILLAVAVIGTFVTQFGLIIPAVFFVIAGLMALLRKPAITETHSYTDTVN